jgi:hypothetical protein
MRVRRANRIVVIVTTLLLTGCAAKHPVQSSPPVVIRSQIPPQTADLMTIKHCVIVQQDTAVNVVTCVCEPVTTVIDKNTRQRTVLCKKMKLEDPRK